MKEMRDMYCILTYLRDQMDVECVDRDDFNSERFHITRPRFETLLEMLVGAGYIAGVGVDYFLSGERMVIFNFPRITFSGLMFLEKDPLMCKIADEACENESAA